MGNFIKYGLRFFKYLPIISGSIIEVLEYIKIKKNSTTGDSNQKNNRGNKGSNSPDPEKSKVEKKNSFKGVVDGIEKSLNEVYKTFGGFAEAIDEGANGFKKNLKTTDNLFKIFDSNIFDKLDSFFKTDFFKGFDKVLGGRTIKALREDVGEKKGKVDEAQKEIDDFRKKTQDKKKKEEDDKKEADLALEKERIEERIELLEAEKENESDIFQQAILAKELLGENQALNESKRKEARFQEDQKIAEHEKKLQEDKKKADKAYEDSQEELAKKENERARKAFFINQNLSLGQVIIDTAVGVAKAFTNPNLFAALGHAAVVTSTGLAQAAIIAAQTAPTLFSGGLIEAGRSAIVGDIPGDFSRAELVTPTSASAVIPSDILEKLALGFSNIASSSSETQNNQNQNNQTQNNFYFDTVDLIEAQNEVQRLSGQPS